MIIGFIKIILILWIASTAYHWYKQVTAGKTRPHPPVDSAPQNPGTIHSGRIVDAEFEEMDSETTRDR